MASFPYIIKPWPPDYRNTSETEKYAHVELSFWNQTESIPGTELCRVVYEMGLQDEDTGWYDNLCRLGSELMYQKRTLANAVICV